MGAIIDNQYVVKRQKSTSFSYDPSSASIDTGFINHFKQNPARTRHRTSARKSNNSFSSTDKRRTSNTLREPSDKDEELSYSTNSRSRWRTGGIRTMFPISALATIGLIAVTIIITSVILKWDENKIKYPEKYANPGNEELIKTGSQKLPIFSIQDFPINVTETTLNTNTANNNEFETVTIQPVMKQDEKAVKEDADSKILVLFEWQSYKVQKGDAVEKIAKKFNVSIGAIIASNNISNVRKIPEGKVLRIPNIDGIPYTIKQGDTLSKIALMHNVPKEVILDVNDIKNDLIKAGETIFVPGGKMNDMDLRASLGDLFRYPINSRNITSRFGMRISPITNTSMLHTGIDIMAKTGDTVMASLDGVISVTNTEDNNKYGKFIIISHSNGYKTLYGHLNKITVKEGDKVLQGKKIGEAGNTGSSTGPHLHFEIYNKNNVWVNPLNLLN